MQQSEGKEKSQAIEFDKHIKKIMDEIDQAKKKSANKYQAIKYDPIKPKSCTFKTPIMEDLYPRIELAE
jgi:hypothetical protein